MSATQADPYTALIAELATMVDLWTRLRAEHGNADGYCVSPKCGQHTAYPCAVKKAADAARAVVGENGS